MDPKIPFNILGYSLGGAIVVKFASVYPEYIHKVSLIAPAGILKSIPLPGYLLHIPILGNLFMFTIGKYIIEYFIKKQLTNLSNPDAARNRLISLAHPRHHPGFNRAYASTVRFFPLTGMEKLFAIVGDLYQDRILCIWVN